MADRKLSTAEILALARQQDQGGASESASASSDKPADQPTETPATQQPAAETPAAETPAAEQPAAAKPPADKPAAGRPSSTKDILAAARAEAGSGEAKPPAGKPAAASPSSTKDVLAAARAQAGGAPSSGPAGQPADKPAAKPAAKPAGKPTAGKAAASPGGARPSVQEMLKAVRSETPVTEEKPAKPLPLPSPRPAKAGSGEKVPRRNVLLQLVATPFAAAWTSFVAASAVAGLGFARFMLPNVIVEPPSKFKIGPPDDYPEGMVSTKWKSEFAVWITHQIYNGQSQIYALSTVCTHLGCTPNWLEGEQKFKCPCHGSGFYADGINFEGPAPRPLERYGIVLAPDGMLEVDKSLKFQEEMGQWADTSSFVAS